MKQRGVGSLKEQKKALRSGYTTGACAAAAAKAATLALLTGIVPEVVQITLPGGQTPSFLVKDAEIQAEFTRCAVEKDAGDDPDVTNGIWVYALARKSEQSSVTGGPGIGRVTKPGLQRPVGEYAINNGPRQMVGRAVAEAIEMAGIPCGIEISLSIPKGEELAARTYNPRLGIIGGISVLGTTGIVEPMSEQALVDSIRAELRVLHAGGARSVLMTPGNYGEVYARKRLGLENEAVLCSNFIGDALDAAEELGFHSVLLVGGLGKLVKLAGGIFNTHSHNADCRLELLTAHAALAGATQALAAVLMNCVTTDEALLTLREAGLWNAVERTLLERISFHLTARAGKMEVAVMLFSEKHGTLGHTPNATHILDCLRGLEERG